jgi:5'(3')-deoxyribonucleotidase
MNIALKKIRLGLDIDGCLYRWSDTARYLLRTYKDNDPGESKTWDWIKDHLPREDWMWLWKDGVEKHGLFRYGSIYKGSREFLVNMQPYCDNVIITSRPPTAVQDTMEWLSYQRVPTSEVHIISSGLKSTVLPHCDVYIDDAIHNAEDLIQNTEALVFMPDRPWNKGFKDKRLLKFYNWYELEQELLEIHGEMNGT